MPGASIAPDGTEPPGLHATGFVAGEILPWSPPQGSVLVASVKRALRGTNFPVDIYNWKLPKNSRNAFGQRLLFVLAVASDDPRSFVAYHSLLGGPKRTVLATQGPGRLSNRIKRAALEGTTEK